MIAREVSLAFHLKHEFEKSFKQAVAKEMGMDEIVIGYDVRRSEPIRNWTEEQKNLFMLKDVDRPFSVDVRVWESLFNKTTLDNADTIGRLCKNLDAIKNLLATTDKEKNTYYLIGITTLFSDDEEEIDFFRAVVDQNAIRQGQFLGYDVAEEVLLSGLLNMGYTPEESVKGKAEFVPHRHQDKHKMGKISENNCTNNIQLRLPNDNCSATE